MGGDGRIGFLGVFRSAALEGAFRTRRFGIERWLCCFLVPVGMVRVALLVLADYQHLGIGSAFWPLLACRLLFLLVSVWMFCALRRAGSPAAADRLFFGWCGLLAALTVFALSARPPENTDLLLMSFVVVIVAYCVTPLPLSRQAILALAYSAAVLWIARRADGATLTLVGLAYVLANLFGASMSWLLNRRRREAFLAEAREAELRTGLEKALGEIKTLRGMQRICAWCKRVRDDEVEAWQAVEAFVQ